MLSRRRFPILAAVFLLLGESGLLRASPITGIVDCLNNEDCLGAHRYCHRNLSMLIGKCHCDIGYKAAVEDKIKCLSIEDSECASDADCSDAFICAQRFLSDANTDGSGRRVFGLGRKTCFNPEHYFAAAAAAGFSGFDEPRTGGGLVGLPSDPHDRFFNIRRGSSHGGHLHPAGFHSRYFKFVEDAMLVLFLVCVLVTLMVIHRASCYRTFRNSRRNGHLRHIIPHRDDEPPPYNNCAAVEVQQTTVRTDDGGAASTPVVVVTSLNGRGKDNMTGNRCGRGRGETPPPTYDEALQISRASNTPMPLYIALPNDLDAATEDGDDDGDGEDEASNPSNNQEVAH